MVKQAVILVGGRATRLNDPIRFTPAIEVPKPLMEVGGKPFITYSINMLKGVGITDIVLLVGYREEDYIFLQDDPYISLWGTSDNVNEAVLEIPVLDDLFLLLNGDCFPLMDWSLLASASEPCVPVKICDRDAGCAVVKKADLRDGTVDVLNIAKMREVYSSPIILGGLHIGTPQGLQRARMFFDIAVFGQ